MTAFLDFIGMFIMLSQACKGAGYVNITVPVNDSTVLPCRVENVERSLWLLTKENPSLKPRTLTSGRRSFFPHLYNLTVANNTHFFKYNVMVIAANLNMEGIYHCQEEGVQRSNALRLVVEVPPTVWLEFNNSKLRDVLRFEVIVNAEYEIRCWAEGGRPSVTLSWEIDGKAVTEGTVQLEDDGNKVSTVIHYRPKLHDKRLSCRTGGQQSIPSIQSDILLNVLYKPVCDIQVQSSDKEPNTYQIHCVCKANPDVSSVFISTNDSIYTQKSVSVLQTNYSTTIFCKARNIVGFSEKVTKTIDPTRIIDLNSSKSLPGKGIITLLIILVFLLISVLAAVAKVHRSQLKSDVEITSHYFVDDRSENDSESVNMVDRSRARTPEMSRRHIQEDEQIYANPEMNSRRTQKLQSRPESYVIPDVDLYEIRKNPYNEPAFTTGSAATNGFQEKTQTGDTEMFNDPTISTTDLSSERILGMDSDGRKQAFQSYASVHKTHKTEPTNDNEKSYGFTDIAIPRWNGRGDVLSVSTMSSTFTDSAYFAFDNNAVPCELYERFSRISKERGDSVRRGKNTAFTLEKNLFHGNLQDRRPEEGGDVLDLEKGCKETEV